MHFGISKNSDYFIKLKYNIYILYFQNKMNLCFSGTIIILIIIILLELEIGNYDEDGN